MVVFPFHNPRLSFLVGKPIVVGETHHFRNPPIELRIRRWRCQLSNLNIMEGWYYNTNYHFQGRFFFPAKRCRFVVTFWKTNSETWLVQCLGRVLYIHIYVSIHTHIYILCINDLINIWAFVFSKQQPATLLQPSEVFSPMGQCKRTWENHGSWNPHHWDEGIMKEDSEDCPVNVDGCEKASYTPGVIKLTIWGGSNDANVW